MRRIEATNLGELHVRLARGQRKDSWLASGVVWAVIVGAHTAWIGALHPVGAVALCWLVVRCWQRSRLLTR